MEAVEEIIIEGDPDEQFPETHSYGQIILDNLQYNGESIAQICNSTGESRTYEDIRRESISLAIALKKIGIQKGDVVSICSENRFEFTVCALAIMYVGAINAPMNILYTENELIHVMNISKPKMIFCSPFTIRNIINVSKVVKYIKHIVTFGNEVPKESVLLYESLIDYGENTNDFKAVEVDLDKHPLVILCSSGTTGLPKGVMLSHKNYIICSQHLRAMTKDFTGEDDCLLLVAPWFHSYGFISNISSLISKVKCVFMSKFEETAFVRAIENYRVSLTMLVPPLLVFLAKHPMVDKYDLSSLKEIWCGAAPLSKEVQTEVKKRLGIKTVKQVYGMTETTLIILGKGKSTTKYGSCGQIMSGTKVKVMSLDSNKALGPFEAGELCFKGPLMMLGYLGDEKATAQIFDCDGWLHTGDVGYYDEDKYFYIVDRIKEIIKYKGNQVPPAELEALLLRHPGVKDAAVIGVPDEYAGELPMAFIVKQPGSIVCENDLIDFVAKNVSKQKRLYGGVQFLNEIPKNPSGKILRRKLRELI